MSIDNGCSMIKCVIFDLNGNEIYVARRTPPFIISKPGMTERDPDIVWKSNVDAISEALINSGVSSRDILAIGLTGYGNGACFINKYGEPTTNCIVSTDSRSNNYLEKWRKNGVEQKVYDLTYQKIWAAQPAALIPWYKDNLPEVLEKSAYNIAIKDYIRFKLTGVICSEFTDASSGCLMNIKTLKFDPEIFNLLGIEKYIKLMPPCIQPTDISGRITHEAALITKLEEGTPVAGGYFDIDAGALASGILSEDVLCLIAGTWSINEYITKDLESGYGKFSNTVSYLPNYYLVEDSSPTSASNFDWFVENFLYVDNKHASKSDIYKSCDDLLSKMSPSDNDIVFIPYLYASSTNPKSKGAFFNLSSYYNRSHLMQAVYEGVVFSTVFHVRRLVKNRPRYKIARFSGGVAKSKVWTQMMCDALQMPIEVLTGTELSARGAAMGAGIAIGVFDNCEQAINHMVHTSKVFIPRNEYVSIYESKYNVFNEAIRTLSNFHNKIDCTMK